MTIFFDTVHFSMNKCWMDAKIIDSNGHFKPVFIFCFSFRSHRYGFFIKVTHFLSKLHMYFYTRFVTRKRSRLHRSHCSLTSKIEYADHSQKPRYHKIIVYINFLSPSNSVTLLDSKVQFMQLHNCFYVTG